MSFEERLHPRGRGGKFTAGHGAGKINVRSRSRNGDEVAQSVRPDELSKGSAGEQRVVADMKAKFPGAKQIDWFGTGLNEGDRVTHTHHGQGTVVRAGTNGKATTVKFDSGETMPVLNHEMVHGEHGPGSRSRSGDTVRPDELSKGSAGEQRVVADMKAKFPGAKQIDWFGTGLNEGDRVTHTHHGQGTVVRAGTNGKATTVKFDSGETMPVLNHEMVHGEHGPGSGSTGPGAAGPKDASHADLMAAKAAGHKVQLHRFDPASKSWVPEGEPTTPDTAIAKAQAAMAGKHVVRLEVRKPGAAEPTGPMRHATGVRHKTEAIRSMRRQA